MSRGQASRRRPQAGGTRARKRFGQHFLRDPSVVQGIVDAIAPRPGELIVEIGPGRGALTFPLLERGCELHAIEIDRDLVAALRSRAPRYPKLVIHEADALRVDLAHIVPPPRRMRVAGNLPYNISTPLVFRFLASLPRIVDMHLMLQREVVERMVSEPGSRTYGRLGVMVQIDCEVERVLEVDCGAFTPAPRVESSVVRLRPRENKPLDSAHRDRLDDIVRSCFSMRRKTLRNALAGQCSESTIIAAGLDPQTRAGDPDHRSVQTAHPRKHGPGIGISGDSRIQENRRPHRLASRLSATVRHPVLEREFAAKFVHKICGELCG